MGLVSLWRRGVLSSRRTGAAFLFHFRAAQGIDHPRRDEYRSLGNRRRFEKPSGREVCDGRAVREPFLWRGDRGLCRPAGGPSADGDRAPGVLPEPPDFCEAAQGHLVR